MRPWAVDAEPTRRTRRPCAGPPLGRTSGADLGLRIAARSALYAEGFSTAGGPPWAGSVALPPATRTVPPERALRGTILVIARGPGGLAWDGAAPAAARFPPEIRAATTAATDRVIIRRIPVTPGTGGRTAPAPWQ